MRVSFVYEDTSMEMETITIDAVPRVGDTVQFLNPIGHPLVVSRVYWQCFHATDGLHASDARPAFANVQVILRSSTLSEIAKSSVPLDCEDLARMLP